jgi:hypothetical protein
MGAMGDQPDISTDSAEGETEQRPFAAGRVAFLALLTDVAKAVRAGIPVKHVHRAYSERLAGISYRQFARYVERYVTNRQEHPPRTAPRKPKARSPVAARCSGGPLFPTIEPRRGFDYRAEGAAKKENLV